ncbi:carbon-nitrogen hydrolase family protein [Nioella aestuarii]|uniref:carbon-nitrogen hydrolase family protein n=1 Tax=Nioella aestuarii TaxID=1662864 RepID=UPI003D7FE3CC
MKIAAVAYHCDRHPGWVAHEAKLDAILKDAAADLVVFPEYAAMEAALVAGPPSATVTEWRDLAAERASAWVDQFRHMAQIHKCHIVAGSGPVKTDKGAVNRSWLIAPDGSVDHQDKLLLLPYEREEMGLIGGDELRLFETSLGKIGLLICYDSEFPQQARALCEAGAEMILVPSCTDFPAGQTRVRQSCRARAIENQCLIVQAPLVGEVPSCEIIDRSTGRAGFFCPPDHGLPADGILAQGETDKPGPITFEVDPAAIAAPRLTGQAGNFSHWSEGLETVTPRQVPARK